MPRTKILVHNYLRKKLFICNFNPQWSTGSSIIFVGHDSITKCTINHKFKDLPLTTGQVEVNVANSIITSVWDVCVFSCVRRWGT